MRQEIENIVNNNHADNLILAKPEHYKGIFFVRLSSLPDEQKLIIRKSHYRESIVKILKDNFLMNDCLIYTDYIKWYNQHHSPRITFLQEETSRQPHAVLSELISLS
jgi:hypothetical protein